MLRSAAAGFLALAMVSSAYAAQVCSPEVVPQPLPLASTGLPPIATELYSRTSQLGMPSGVLTQSYDAAESLDRVLLRLKIEECRSIVTHTPPATTAADGTGAAVAAAAADAAAYQPRTEYDNTPWRFDMSQNGKRMTADEFDAWMKAKGVRVARGRTPAAEAPAAVSADPATAESN